LVPIIKHGRLFVLFDQEKPIGTLELMADWDDSEKAYIYGLAIDPEYQNRDLGTKLFKYGLCKLVEEGFSTTTLTVDPANRAAIHLYKDKLNFKIVDQQEDIYGPEADRLFMEMDLAEFAENKKDVRKIA